MKYWNPYGLLMLLPMLAGPAMATSYDCTKVAPGSIEELVCETPKLNGKDEQLAKVYKQAVAKAKGKQGNLLKAEQKGWLKGRDECWKADDKTQCVMDSYQQRIAELQVGYALVPGKGPFTFRCDSKPVKELKVTFYPTEPTSLSATFDGSTSLMYAKPSASGSKYQGRNESFWEHQGVAKVVWGYEAPEMACKRLP